MTPRTRISNTVLAALVAISFLVSPWPPSRIAAAQGPPATAAPSATADVAAARAVFERNLAAIADKDRDAYLATYLHAETLARTGPEGPSLGFADLAAQADDGWPAVFEAQDLRLVPVAPGVVYGTYRYRVAYRPEEGGPLDEHAGISERLFLETPDGWRIAVTSAVDAPPGTPPPPRALVGATLVTGTTLEDGTPAPPIPDAVVVMRNGLIDCAGSREACPVPEGIGVVDLAGRWIAPGLVDAHVHFSQTGWADGRPDALDVRDRFPYAEAEADLAAHPERFFRALLCSGVTAAFDVGGYPWTLGLPARAEADTRAPHMAAAGPLLSTLDHWLNLPAERQFIPLTDAASARAGVDYLAARGADAVKVWFIVSDELPVEKSAPVVAAAGAAAAAHDLPLIVHATGLAEAKAALRAGAKVLVHSVWDRPVDDELLDLARRAGAIYVPTLTVSRGYLRLYRAAFDGAVPEIDDPNHCVGAATRARLAATATVGTGGLTAERIAAMDGRIARQEEIAAANLVRVREAGIPIAMGTDAGNPLTLHGPSVYAEMEAMETAGLSPADVLVAATDHGARAMGRGDDLGTVEPGKQADLVVLAADPTAAASAWRAVTQVVRGGVLRPVSELAAP